MSPETEPPREEASAKERRTISSWIAFVFSCAAFALTGALALVYLAVNDRTAWGEYLTIWPPLLWCFGLVSLAVLGWNRRAKRRFAISAGAIALFLLLTSEWRALVRWPDREGKARFAAIRGGGGEPGGTALRIVSWNINGGWGGGDRSLARLRELDPDLCFIQETPDGSLELTGTWLAEREWEGYHALDAGDCGLISRYPIRALESPRVGPWTPPLAAAIALPDGRELLTVNVRLTLPSLILNPFDSGNRDRLARDHASRVAQFPALRDYVDGQLSDAHFAGAILGGDFNTPGRMRSLAPLRRGLRDAWRIAGRGRGSTMTNEFPVERIDQCWVSPEVEIIDARVVDGTPSDHRMLIVDLIVH